MVPARRTGVDRRRVRHRTARPPVAGSAGNRDLPLGRRDQGATDAPRQADPRGPDPDRARRVRLGLDRAPSAAREGPAGDTLDPDAIYLACLGHDLGLARLDPARSTDDCFTLVGADEVGGIGPSTTATGTAVRAAMEAIVHHITPGLTTAVDDPLAVYVRQGSLCDLTRQRARLVPEIDLDLLDRAYPRTVLSTDGPVELEDLVAELWPIESAQVPDGRARLLNTGGCFTTVVQQRPFRA